MIEEIEILIKKESYGLSLFYSPGFVQDKKSAPLFAWLSVKINVILTSPVKSYHTAKMITGRYFFRAALLNCDNY